MNVVLKCMFFSIASVILYVMTVKIYISQLRQDFCRGGIMICIGIASETCCNKTAYCTDVRAIPLDHGQLLYDCMA